MQKERPRQLNAWTYSVAGLHGNAVRDNHANGEVKEEGGAKRLQDKGAATNAKPLRFAVVGSGPAGFYTADRVSDLDAHLG